MGGLGSLLLGDQLSRDREADTMQLKQQQEQASKIKELMAIAENVKMMQETLDNIPSASGWKSIPAGAWEETKQLVHENPELDKYEGMKGLVGNMMARQVGQEKGNMTDRDYERAIGLIPSAYSSTETRGNNFSAIQQLMETLARANGGSIMGAFNK